MLCGLSSLFCHVRLPVWGGSSWGSRVSSFRPPPPDWQACKSKSKLVRLKSRSPLESGCFSPKAFVVWVEGVVGIAVLLSLGIRRYCVGGKSGHWSSRAIEDGSVVVPVVAVVVVVGGGGGWSSNKGCHRNIEGVSGCVARELVGPRILNLISRNVW